MTRKVDVPVNNRDIYFTPAGDPLWSGTSPETAVDSPFEAIARVSALVPDPSDDFPASINASQSGRFTDGILMPDNTSAECQLSSIITTADLTAITAGNRQTHEWQTLGAIIDNGMTFKIDGKDRVDATIGVLFAGADGDFAPETTGNVGIQVMGDSDDIFIDVRQALPRGNGAIVINHIATTETPISYELDTAEFFNEDQTIIVLNSSDPLEQVECTIKTVRESSSAIKATTGSCVFDIQSGLLSAFSNSLQAEDIAKVGADGQLLVTVGVASGDFTVSDGGALILDAGLLIGDLDVDASSTSVFHIKAHVGSITGDGVKHGIANGVRYGNYLQPFGCMFQVNNAVVTTINTQNVFEDVLNFTTGELEQTTFGSSVLTTGSVATTYLVTFSACLENSTNVTYELAVEVDGVVRDESHTCATIATGGNDVSLSGNFILAIGASKDIKLVVANKTNTSNVTVLDASLSIVGIR